MFNWLLRMFGFNSTSHKSEIEKADPENLVSDNSERKELTAVNNVLAENNQNISTEVSLVPYDENLLEKAKIQWQFGDWESLAGISRESLQHHPDRAKLAALAAAGHGQSGNVDKCRQFVRLAQDWGCTRKQICQVLVSNLHNTIGRAALLGGYDEKANLFFERSITTGFPVGDTKLLTEARVDHQKKGLQLRSPPLEKS